jgi:DNA replication protein DnaC
MDDKMRRIAANDLSISTNTPAASSDISTDAAATKATSDSLCPVCRGAGYYVLDVPYGHPQFGRLVACHCKDEELQRLRAQKLLQMSNLEPFRNKTFANFDRSVPGVQRAYARALEFARHPRGWLVLIGGYGCGKTHLAAAIANEVLEVNYEVLFTVVPDLLDHLRSTFGPTSEIAYDERFEQIRSAKLLILDDLGTENATPWAREKLYQIINHRYNYALPTVITTNREPKDIDPRVLSRLEDTELCPERIMIDAGDYRRLNSTQRQGARKPRNEPPGRSGPRSTW